METGAKLALKAVNDAGGVLGRSVNLVSQDDGGDPVDAIPAAQKEINSDHVVAFIGPDSGTAGVVQNLATKANIPMMMYGGGTEFDADTNPNFFRMSPSDSEQAAAMVLFAKSKGWTKVALAFGSDNGGQGAVPAVVAAAKASGLQVVANVTVTADQTNYRSQLGQIFGSHPQAVLSQLDEATSGVVFSEVAQEGYSATPWIGTNIWYEKTWFNTVGAKAAAGQIYIANSTSAGMLGNAKFLALLKQQTGSNVPQNAENFMYDAVLAWALGAEAAGTTSWPAIRTGILKAANPPGVACGDYATCANLLKSGQDIDFQGAASSVDFNKYDNVFGPFSILHYSADGSTTDVVDFTSQQLENAS